MSDDAVAKLLDSDSPLVVIEAPAGCGKTFQGSKYARRAASAIGTGRLLVLTHTHGACSVFAANTKEAGSKVEIRTIDALIAQIAGAYHKSLGLPANPCSSAWRDGGKGFEIMGKRVAELLAHQPMIAAALARRYPIIICDEHQDSSSDQHAIIMALHSSGARLRIFGDPMQRLFGAKSDKAVAQDRARWDALKTQGESEQLKKAHRWKDTAPELGEWILDARGKLRAGEQIDLTGNLPSGLSVLYAENTSPTPKAIMIAKDERKPIDNLVSTPGQMMILGGNNGTIDALHSFWGRRFPIWEGHTREGLGNLVDTCFSRAGDAPAVAEEFIRFVQSVGTGFSASSHGDRLMKELGEACAKPTKGKPANIQELARLILQGPNHRGVSSALRKLAELIASHGDGFDEVVINYKCEFNDAIRLGEYENPEEGFAELARRRSHANPMPPAKALSTIHKAKGLQCDNAIIMACDGTRFSSTDYARSKMYVALSRAMKSLTLVVSRNDPSPILRIAH
jgi:hypothetical protein